MSDDLVRVGGYKVAWIPHLFGRDEVFVWADVPWLHFPLRRYRCERRRDDGRELMALVVAELGGQP